MIDPKRIRNQPDEVRENLRKRGAPDGVDRFLVLDARRRELLQEGEEHKALRNTASREIGRKVQQGEDPAEMREEMRVLGERIQTLDEEIRATEEELTALQLGFPNMLHPSVPEGKSEEDNREIRCWGELPRFDFAPRPHWELGAALDIIDAERAARVSGARFVFMKGAGARLERALVNLMLDLHGSKQGYQEVVPPFLVGGDSMQGTGQLPKFASDMFRVEGQDLYLIPTAEVPLTNLYRDEILEPEQVPQKIAAYSPCFRAEAGAAGRETRGLIRQHQFNKVELVKFVRPEDAEAELESLVREAAAVLEALELPYRVVLLCSGDTGFASARTFDLEVWMAGAGCYREISSCSHYGDFQARRASIRFRREKKGRPEYVHTLNGSGLAVGRTLAALLENNQQADGTVRIPPALQPYMGGLERIG